MSKIKSIGIITGITAVLAVPFVASVSCASFFTDHSLFDEGNFEFYYTNTGDVEESKIRFNEEVVSKREVLLGASLSAQEIYDTDTSHPDIIGISPEKALTSNGVFLSNAFSDNDKIDIANYLQTLWWVSNWRRGSAVENVNNLNKPVDTKIFNVPPDIELPEEESTIVDDMLNKYFPGKFVKRNEVNDLIFNYDDVSNPYMSNLYRKYFSTYKLQYPKLYYPGDKIMTTFGSLDAYSKSVNPRQNILDTSLFSWWHPANETYPQGEIDLNIDGEITTEGVNSDMYQFLNIYAPYVYMHYQPLKITSEGENKQIRVVILDEAINAINAVDTSEALRQRAAIENILQNDGVNFDRNNANGDGVMIVRSKNEALRLLKDSSKYTICIMPITEWASENNRDSSLVASYRMPASFTSLDDNIDVNGNITLDGSAFRIDESYALELITKYFDLWINDDGGNSTSGLLRRNYNLDDLRIGVPGNRVIDKIGKLNWTDGDRERYYEPLLRIVDDFDAVAPNSPGKSAFSYGANYDMTKHKWIDDVKTELFSEGTNTLIYYSTNSDGISETMDINSQVIENRIVNSHGDGKINLRNEMALPVAIAMHRSSTFNDADITESVKAWIEEHFTVE